MTNWTPPPATVMWTLDEPIRSNDLVFKTVTLSAPRARHVLKATAVSGRSPYDITRALIAAVSAEQLTEEAALELPDWMVGQMSAYFDSFTRGPEPDPLAQWRAAQRAVSEPAPAS